MAHLPKRNKGLLVADARPDAGCQFLVASKHEGLARLGETVGDQGQERCVETSHQGIPPRPRGEQSPIAGVVDFPGDAGVVLDGLRARLAVSRIACGVAKGPKKVPSADLPLEVLAAARRRRVANELLAHGAVKEGFEFAEGRAHAVCPPTNFLGYRHAPLEIGGCDAGKHP